MRPIEDYLAFLFTTTSLAFGASHQANAQCYYTSQGGSIVDNVSNYGTAASGTGTCAGAGAGGVCLGSIQAALACAESYYQSAMGTHTSDTYYLTV